MCMLFIKASKWFTVHCSFLLPVGARAVIPVSEGSDGGHCWSVGVVRSACPDYITAFNGISWWEIPRVMGIKIPGLSPMRHLTCGPLLQKCCPLRTAGNHVHTRFKCPHTQIDRTIMHSPLDTHLWRITASLGCLTVKSDTKSNSLGEYQVIELLKHLWTFGLFDLTDIVGSGLEFPSATAKVREQTEEKTFTWTMNKRLRAE